MSQLFAITGITGNVGGHAAEVLLAAGHRVRAIVRDEASEAAKAWKSRQNVELVVASFTDVAALSKAFDGVDAAFVLTPPLMKSAHAREESLILAQGAKSAVLQSGLSRVVLLSSVGGHLADDRLNGPIAKCYDLEQLFLPLASKDLAVTFLRAGYFAENTLGTVAHAQVSSTYVAILPLHTMLPIVTTKDIGTQVARLLTEPTEQELRIVELEGPQRITFQDMANTFFKLSGRTMPIVEVPHNGRAAVLKGAGASQEVADWFVPMLAGFESGACCFEGNHEHVKGTHLYEEFLAEAFAKQQKL